MPRNNSKFQGLVDVTRAEQENKQTSELSNKETIERVPQGFRMKKELIKRVKIRAAEEGRAMYEILEDALEEYLKKG